MPLHWRQLCFAVTMGVAIFVPIHNADGFQAGASIAAGGQLQGKIIVENDGSAVPGVTVTVVQLSTTPKASAINSIFSVPVVVKPIAVVTGGAIGSAAAGDAATGSTTATTTASTATAADGSFNVSGLATGQFAVCVKDSKSAVIDPCLWTDFQTTVPVTTGNVCSGLVVRVKKASTVSIRVNDQAQVLAQKSSDRYPPHIVVGAFDIRGGFHPARETKDSTGISYQLPIPVDSPVRLTVYSQQVKLATSSNIPIAAQGYSATFVQPSGQNQPTSFTFNAIGRN